MTGKSALTSIVALLLVACGGSQPTAKTPSADDAAPRTVEEAQDQIDTARVAIDQGFANASVDGGAETSVGAPTVSGAGGTAAEPSAPSAELCASQCRALDSMKRAVEALCRMTGDNEGRCVSAKRTFDASATRVAPCKCPNAPPAPLNGAGG